MPYRESDGWTTMAFPVDNAWEYERFLARELSADNADFSETLIAAIQVVGTDGSMKIYYIRRDSILCGNVLDRMDGHFDRLLSI